MKKNKEESLKGIEKAIADAMTSLPRLIKVTEPMEGRVSEGEVELHLIVRFEDVDRFSVAYISRHGDFIFSSKDAYMVGVYETTDLVADFSLRFGWIEDKGIMEPLTQAQKDGVRTVSESVLDIFRAFPSSIHLQVIGGAPSFSLDESDESRPLFSTVDVSMHNGHVTWTYVIIPEDKASGFLVDSINQRYEKVDLMRVKGRFFNNFGLDLDFEKMKHERNGPFSVSFMRGDIPMAPDALGIPEGRASMLFDRLEQLHDGEKDPCEVFEALSDLCMSKEELFFVGWLLGTIQMKALVDELGEIDPRKGMMEAGGPMK